jgi:hypothetical protein
MIEQLDRDERIKDLLDSFANFCDIVNDSKKSELGKNDRLVDVLHRASVQMTEVAYFVRNYCKDGGFCKHESCQL